MTADDDPASKGSAPDHGLRSKLAPLGADFMKFFAGAVVAGTFVAGFVYTNEYFHSFGISALEIDVGYAQAAAFGTYLLRDVSVFIAAIFSVAIASIVVALSRYRFGNFGFYLSVAVLFVVLFYLAVYLGDATAERHSASVIDGSTGTIATCTLRTDVDFPDRFREKFESMTSKGSVRKIITTDDTIYLSFAIANPPEGYHGRSFALKKSDILYCRFDGN